MTAKDGLRILFINLPAGNAGGKGNFLPLGIAQLASVLEAVGHRVKAIDMACNLPAERLNYLYFDPHFRREIADFRPHIAGLSATSMSRRGIGFMCRELRAMLPDCLLVAGGSHVTFMAEHTLATVPELDLCVTGEGEAAMLGIAEAVAAGRPTAGMPGTVYREGLGVSHGEPAPLVQNLDALPFPARDLFPVGSYDIEQRPFTRHKLLTMITSRGCVGKCKFCVAGALYDRYRFQSAERVLAEIYHCRTRYPHIESIFFYDDTLTIDKKRLAGILDGLRRSHAGVRWGCYSRADVMTDEMARNMAASGCELVVFGFESGSDAMLRRMNKRVTREQGMRAVEACRRHGITARGNFIIGLYGESVDEALDTADFIRQTRLGADAAIFKGTFILPGTPWHQEYMAAHPDFSWEEKRESLSYILDSKGDILVPFHSFPYETYSKVLDPAFAAAVAEGESMAAKRA